MPEKQHRLINNLFRLQTGLRKLTGAIPTPPQAMLTAPEPYGPDLERFRRRDQALISWSNKQNQTWTISGNLTTQSSRSFAFSLSFGDRRNQADFIGILPTQWVRERTFSAAFSLIDPLNAKPEQTYQYWQKGGLLDPAQGFAGDGQMHIEVGGWIFRQEEDFSFSLRAHGDSVGLSLNLNPAKELVYNEFGHSFNCGYTRMSGKGTLRLQDKLFEVAAQASVLHEKSTARKSDVADSADISRKMEQVVLRRSGTEKAEELIIRLDDPRHIGTWIDSDGNPTHLKAGDINISNLEYWTSDKTRGRYPVRRRVDIPSLGLSFELRSPLHDQEIAKRGPSYSAQWSGLIEARGTKEGKEFTASGFAQLHGYDKRPLTQALHFLTAP